MTQPSSIPIPNTTLVQPIGLSYTDVSVVQTKCLLDHQTTSEIPPSHTHSMLEMVVLCLTVVVTLLNQQSDW